MKIGEYPENIYDLQAAMHCELVDRVFSEKRFNVDVNVNEIEGDRVGLYTPGGPQSTKYMGRY